MAKEVKVSKEDVLVGALQWVRKYGIDTLNARNLAKFLGCSTQPIYSAFKNMGELKAVLYLEAQKTHKAYVAEYINKIKPSNYKAYGMGFVKFAKNEKQLFNFLYMQNVDSVGNSDNMQSIDKVENIDIMQSINNKQNAGSMSSVDNMQPPKGDGGYDEEVILQLVKDYDISKDEAKQFHDYMAIFTFGLALLQSRGANYSDETVALLLKNQFFALARLFLKDNSRVEEYRKKVEGEEVESDE